MVRDFKSRIQSRNLPRAAFSFLLLFLPVVAAAAETAAPRVAPCFDVRVEFRGREETQNINHVQYYRWTYRVYGGSCINRALSNWLLQLCSSTRVSGISTLSIDASDPPGGMQTNYNPELGPDPNYGVYGLKWDFLSGNAIDRNAEYDEFSFIASGPITTINWWAKGALFFVSGTTQGPGCLPVSKENLTWGALKTRY